MILDCQCTVCFEVTTDAVEACGHSLCHECLQQCFKYHHHRCPVCRGPIASEIPNEYCKHDEGVLGDENILDDDELTLLQFLRLPRDWGSWWLPERPRTIHRWQRRIFRA